MVFDNSFNCLRKQPRVVYDKTRIVSILPFISKKWRGKLFKQVKVNKRYLVRYKHWFFTPSLEEVNGERKLRLRLVLSQGTILSHCYLTREGWDYDERFLD